MTGLDVEGCSEMMGWESIRVNNIGQDEVYWNMMWVGTGNKRASETGQDLIHKLTLGRLSGYKLSKGEMYLGNTFIEPHVPVWLWNMSDNISTIILLETAAHKIYVAIGKIDKMCSDFSAITWHIHNIDFSARTLESGVHGEVTCLSEWTLIADICLIWLNKYKQTCQECFFSSFVNANLGWPLWHWQSRLGYIQVGKNHSLWLAQQCYVQILKTYILIYLHFCVHHQGILFGWVMRLL